jgi:hypothetical protein
MFLARKEDGKPVQVYKLADLAVIKGKLVKCDYDQYLIDGWRFVPKRIDGDARSGLTWTENGRRAICGNGWAAASDTAEKAKLRVRELSGAVQ